MAAAQHVEIIKWKRFEALLQRNNDTLYVYHFWASWCVPCVTEIPNFIGVAEQYRDRQVKVVLVSLDFIESYKQSLIPYLNKHAIKQNVLLLDEPDYNSWIDKIASTWEGDIPATLFIKGPKKLFMAKSFTKEALASTIQTLL